jgi:transcriptional regulator with XRE-family HTH domain
MEKPSPESSPHSESLEAYGRLMRDVRRRAGLSVRSAAVAAKVDKNTILRLEAGLPIREKSRLQICSAYGIFDLLPGTEPRMVQGEHFAYTSTSLQQWYRAKLKGLHEPSQVTTDPAFSDQEERRRQGRLGFSNQFFSRLDCFRETSQMRSGVFEVFGPSGYSQQQSGEAFVYVISGAITFEVGEDSFTLGEGQACTFDRAILHLHKPASFVPNDQLPCVMLYVQCE